MCLPVDPVVRGTTDKRRRRKSVQRLLCQAEGAVLSGMCYGGITSTRVFFFPVCVRGPGIIGAQRDNKMGVSGISNHARIIALKILDKKGEGDVSHAIPAIRYALDNGAKVITNSWGGISGR